MAKAVQSKKRDASNPYAWLDRPEGRLFNNLTILDTKTGREELATITGKVLVDAVRNFGGKIAIFDSKSQWYAFHETTVSEKHPGLGGRDLTAEIIAAGKRHGIRYVPYVPVDADLRAKREHPDWSKRSADGTTVDGVMPSCCGNSPFRHFMADYLGELAKNYDIAGLWFDGLGVDICYCDHCRKGFRDRHGLELPTDVTQDWHAWAKWAEYRKETTEDIVREWHRSVDRFKPGLPMVGNYSMGSNFRGLTFFQEADLQVLSHEVLWSWASNSVQYLRAESGKPPESYIPAAQYGSPCPVSKPLAELRSGAMQTLTHGGYPCFYMAGTPASVRHVNQELAARADWVVNTENVPYCGLVNSGRTQLLADRSEWGDDIRFMINGILRALLEDKVPENMVTDRQLANDDLSRYAVLILPDMCIVDEKTADRLRAYVKDGGGLVALHNASRHDAEGQLVADFMLADLFGVHCQGEMPPETKLKPWLGDIRDGIELPNSTKHKLLNFGRHPIVNDPIIRETLPDQLIPGFRRGFPAGVRLIYDGPMLQVETEKDVTMSLWEEYQQPGKRWPLITTRSHGKGRVVYIAAPLGAMNNANHTYPFLRRLITNSVRFAAGAKKPPFRIAAPLHIEVMLYRQPEKGRQVLHLLNYPKPVGLAPFRCHLAQKPQEEVIPIFDIEVSLLGKFKAVYTAPGRKPLKTTFADGYTTVVVPRLDTHLMVVADEACSSRVHRVPRHLSH
jgi:type 1 glutamine amidotransferase